jgi:hypothetical protein
MVKFHLSGQKGQATNRDKGDATMSETTPEVVESEESEPVVPTVTRESLDDLGQMMLKRIDAWGAEATNSQAILAAANSDDAKAMVVTLRDGSPGYDEYQSLIAKAEAILAEIDKNNESKVEKPSDEQVSQATETLASLRDQAKAAMTFLVGAYGDGAKDLMPASLKGKRGGGAKGTTGIKRPRMQAIIVSDKDGAELIHLKAGAEKPEDKPTFSALAKWLSDTTDTKVETSALQDAAFDAAGTKDLSTVPKVEFAHTIGDNHYFIVANSKQTG